MDGIQDMFGVLLGTVSCPAIMVTNFSSNRMLVFSLLYFAFEGGLFRLLGTHLAIDDTFASVALLVTRTIISLLLGSIWWFKTEEGNETPKTTLFAPRVLQLQSAALGLLTLALSIQAAYDVFVLNPRLIGLSPHALLTLSGLKQVAPFAFFVVRDTPFKALIPCWFFSVIVCLTCCLYSHDRQQLSTLLLYTSVSFVIFADTLKQNRIMCDTIAKLQNTLKENEALAMEAQALELRAMIGNVAHDLKTPLTSFLSGIECMHDMLAKWNEVLHDPDFKWTDECLTKCRAANKEHLDCLQNMSDANSFMTMTINRCLDYTKSSNGFKLVPTFETVSLRQAFDMPLKLMQGAQHAVSIVVNDISDLICSHVITDKQWLIENLLCLLSNASKYSAKGTVTVDVFKVLCSADDIPRSPHSRCLVTSAASQRSTKYLRFEVQDTGIGLSDEAMQGLFNPFKQAQRLAGGTGLGLFSLAKRVEALQGQYGVMRRPDGEQGSLFWFTIPYRPDELTARLTEQRADIVRRCQSLDSVEGDALLQDLETVEQYNVLVVDDAPLIVKMTTMLLQRKGHTVQHAVNGADALEKLCVHTGNTPRPLRLQLPDDATNLSSALPFDVVLMDLQMPVLDGIEAIRRLRAAEDKQKDVRTGTKIVAARQFVIALSANSDEETRQEALAAGADAFMPKPFTYDDFLVTMADQKRLV